jgi:hypothetical protein
MVEKYYRLLIEPVCDNISYNISAETLKQFLQNKYKKTLYLNFEKPMYFEDYEETLKDFSKEYINSLIILDICENLYFYRVFVLNGELYKYRSSPIFPSYKDILLGKGAYQVNWKPEKVFKKID